MALSISFESPNYFASHICGLFNFLLFLLFENRSFLSTELKCTSSSVPQQCIIEIIEYLLNESYKSSSVQLIFQGRICCGTSKDKVIGKEFCLDNAKIRVTETQGVSDKFSR